MPKPPIGSRAAKPGADLSVLDATKAVPPDEEGGDLSWLDNGLVPLEAADVDPSLAQIPGRLENLPVEIIVPNPWNPNEQSDKEFDMLVRRMREVGMISPIQVVPTVNEETGEETYTIIGGEHRWRAAKALGYPTIPAVILTDERFQNEDLQKFVTMQLNMIAGKLNPEKFLKLYNEMTARYNDKAMADLMGFTKQHAFKMMTKGVADGLPEDMKEEFRKRADGLKDPKQLKGLLTDLLGKYGNDLRFNFMIFTCEDKEHIWCRLDEANHKLVAEVLDLCRTRALDVNVVIEEAFKAALDRFTSEVAA